MFDNPLLQSLGFSSDEVEPPLALPLSSSPMNEDEEDNEDDYYDYDEEDEEAATTTVAPTAASNATTQLLKSWRIVCLDGEWKGRGQVRT